VTRHVLHLIDHGALCDDHKGMTFTNKKCHCKQSWTTKGGKEMKYPENCGDPGGEKGYPWCETYSEENCVGTGGSVEWDRCDLPSEPITRVSQEKGVAGMVTAVDHYLCVCVDINSKDEVCTAAVKAACSVGHIPSDQCAKSFASQDHDAISDEILRLIQNGAMCKNSRIPVASSSDQKALASGNGNLPIFCGKGYVGGDGKCVCNQGYKGVYCEECMAGYWGFPNCVKNIECKPECSRGVCDYSNGKCSCPINFVGDSCDKCADGYVGPHCIPSEMSGSFFENLLYIVVGLGLFYFLYTKYTGGKSGSKDGRVPAMHWSGQASATEDDYNLESGTIRPRNQHNGLAI